MMSSSKYFGSFYYILFKAPDYLSPNNAWVHSVSVSQVGDKDHFNLKSFSAIYTIFDEKKVEGNAHANVEYESSKELF